MNMWFRLGVDHTLHKRGSSAEMGDFSPLAFDYWAWVVDTLTPEGLKTLKHSRQTSRVAWYGDALLPMPKLLR